MASQLKALSRNRRVAHDSRYEHLETWSGPDRRKRPGDLIVGLLLLAIGLGGLAWLLTQ